MPFYRVPVTRDVTETANVIVEADTPDQAIDDAIALARSLPLDENAVRYTPDDCMGSDPYIADLDDPIEQVDAPAAVEGETPAVIPVTEREGIERLRLALSLIDDGSDASPDRAAVAAQAMRYVDQLADELFDRTDVDVRRRLKPCAPCPTPIEQGLFVVLYGSPMDGWRAFGPFDSDVAAADWGESMGEGGEFVMQVHPYQKALRIGLYNWSDKPDNAMLYLGDGVYRAMADCTVGDLERAERTGSALNTAGKLARVRSILRNEAEDLDLDSSSEQVDEALAVIDGEY